MLCFACAERIARSDFAYFEAEPGLVPDIPELYADGRCPVCNGTRPLDPQYLDG